MCTCATPKSGYHHTPRKSAHPLARNPQVVHVSSCIVLPYCSVGMIFSATARARHNLDTFALLITWSQGPKRSGPT